MLWAALAAGCGDADREQPAPRTTAASEHGHVRIYVADMEDWGEIAALTLSRDDYLELYVHLQAPDGQPIAGRELRVTSQIGNEIPYPRPVTGPDGRALTAVRATEVGPDTLQFTGGLLAGTIALVVNEGTDAAGHETFAVPKNRSLPQLPGVVSWSTLGKVESREAGGIPRPTFSPEVKSLHGTRVKLVGFMLPLESAEKQNHFLLSANPPTCFFCMPGGPESIVEVRSTEAVAVSFDPLLLDGTLELLEQDDMGLFYRLSAARAEKGL